MGNVLAAVIDVVFQILWYAILIRVLMSWLPMAGIRIDPDNALVRMLYQITDPLLDPIRKYTTVGMVDLSPIVVLIGLDLIRAGLISLITGA